MKKQFGETELKNPITIDQYEIAQLRAKYDDEALERKNPTIKGRESSIEDQIAFHGDLDENQASQVLKEAKVGDFLLRFDRRLDNYLLSVKIASDKTESFIIRKSHLNAFDFIRVDPTGKNSPDNFAEFKERVFQDYKEKGLKFLGEPIQNSAQEEDTLKPRVRG